MADSWNTRNTSIFSCQVMQDICWMSMNSFNYGVTFLNGSVAIFMTNECNFSNRPAKVLMLTVGQTKRDIRRHNFGL